MRSRAVDRDLRRELATARSRDGARSRRQSRDHAVDREIAIFAAIFARSRHLELGLEIGAAWRSTDYSVSSPLSRARALSLFFRKCFEVKMRGENHFRVKCENIGQPEVIFRKILFSVTAKHAENGENDFLKSFSPKTNAPYVHIGSRNVG